jgi:hypothetical protein
MTKYWLRISLSVILMLSFGAAQAQFVELKLSIPGGATFEFQVENPLKGDSWEKSKAISWIELTVHENLAFVLEIQYPERIIDLTLESFFLNDGTSNFEKSSALKSASQAVVMHKSGILIRKMNPRPIELSAWLGLPMTKGIAVKIEYP